ncbi:MAG: hypothetical protein AAGB00_11020 [Planctomycetota bacterium]
MEAFSADQKREVCTIAAVGCDRQIAARYLGCTMADLQRAIQSDASFARSLEQAEAGAELVHMKNLKDAAQEEKNWRASVWWLERRSPDRYGRRDARSVTPTQLQKFVEALGRIIAEEVHYAEDRDRLLSRLEELLQEVAGPEANVPEATGPESAGRQADCPDAASEEQL